MKTSITPEMIHTAYQVAKSIYSGSLSNKAGEKQLTQECKMALKSAQDYIRCYLKMIQGESFTHTINAYGIQYYLDNIMKDDGEEKLRAALESLRLHIHYRKSLKVNERKKQNIYDSFIEEFNFENKPFLYPEEIFSTKKFKEGRVIKLQVNAYERNRRAREKCIKIYGVSCVICGFNFEDVYGKLGKGFIHVHHLKEIASRKEEYEINPIKDLRPVCPNCHAMIHSPKKKLTISTLKKKLTNHTILR